MKTAKTIDGQLDDWHEDEIICTDPAGDICPNLDLTELYADYDEYKDSVGKKGLKNNIPKLTELVKNIYKTLLSRGMKGCYVYIRDKNLQEYFKKRLNLTNN